VRTTRIRLDRIASSTRNAHLGPDVILGDRIVAEEGYVIAVRILDDRATYNTVEDPAGRMVPLRRGDVLAGVLGARRALRGFVGEVPRAIAAGDTIEVLNLGGILGRCTSAHPEQGAPFRAEVLGAVLSFPALGDRVGRPTHIRDHAVPAAERLESRVPVVYVAGTCMNAGKTVAAAELVRGLSRAGRAVAAAKLTGVSLLRDALAMLDAGAVQALTFNDVGIATTRGGITATAAKGILNRLAAGRPDVIVAELGDGILGDYGVQDVLADPELASVGAAYVGAAPDPVGCWGAVRLMGDLFGLGVHALTGPATDNAAGRDYVREKLGLPAHNAQRDPAGLVAVVERALEAAAERAVAAGWRGDGSVPPAGVRDGERSPAAGHQDGFASPAAPVTLPAGPGGARRATSGTAAGIVA
jgi:hypothetical protein